MTKEIFDEFSLSFVSCLCSRAEVKGLLLSYYFSVFGIGVRNRFGIGILVAVVFVLKVCSLSLSVDGFFCFGARLFSLDSLEGWEYRNEGVELGKADNDRDNA